MELPTDNLEYQVEIREEGELNALPQETPLRGLDNLSAKMLTRFSEQMG